MARTRSLANQVARLLASTAQPIYALDDRRRIVYCNEACEAWLGLELNQLVGQQCDYHAGSGRDSPGDAAARLCPPPDVLHGDEVTSAVIAPGATAERSVTFVPLHGDDGEVVSVVAFVAAHEASSTDSVQPSLDEVDSDDLHRRLQTLAGELRTPYRLDRLVGESFAIRRIRQQVEAAIETQVPVLVIGPEGSGREHIARTIHHGKSQRTAGPLMPLSCAALDAELLQTTVLAFLTRCQHEADAATLLLLDIDQLDVEAQAELLAFFRVPTFSLRTIVTARRPLQELANIKQFLGDLAQALSTLVIELPPLAERRPDIPYLAQQFLEQYNATGGKQLQGFTHAALDRLCSLPWPGNVAELSDVVQAMCDHAEHVTVGEEDYPDRVRWLESAAAHPPPPDDETIKLDDFLVEIERELIQRALRQARGNKAQAARLLGISRPRLLRRVTQLGLES